MNDEFRFPGKMLVVIPKLLCLTFLWLKPQSPQISSGLHTKVTEVIRIAWKYKLNHARVIGVSFFHFLPVVDVISLSQP